MLCRVATLVQDRVSSRVFRYNLHNYLTAIEIDVPIRKPRGGSAVRFDKHHPDSLPVPGDSDWQIEMWSRFV